MEKYRMRPGLYSVLAVSSGALCLFALPAILASLDNFFHIRGNEVVAIFLVRSFLGYLFGVFSFAALHSIVKNAPEGQRPIFVTLGSLGGVLLGYLIAGVLSSFFPKSTPEYFFNFLFPAAMLTVSFFVTQFVSRFTAKLPPRRSRVLISILIMAPLLVLLAGTVSGRDFPARASMDARHEWAAERFGAPYECAVAFVRGSSAIRDDAGERIEVAPSWKGRNVARHQNDFYQSKAATFALEVKGEKGNGIITLEARTDDDSAGKPLYCVVHEGKARPLWEWRGKRTVLGPDGGRSPALS